MYVASLALIKWIFLRSFIFGGCQWILLYLESAFVSAVNVEMSFINLGQISL